MVANRCQPGLGWPEPWSLPGSLLSHPVNRGWGGQNPGHFQGHFSHTLSTGVGVARTLTGHFSHTLSTGVGVARTLIGHFSHTLSTGVGAARNHTMYLPVARTLGQKKYTYNNDLTPTRGRIPGNGPFLPLCGFLLETENKGGIGAGCWAVRFCGLSLWNVEKNAGRI